MESLEKRIADRRARREASLAPAAATRDDLQAAAEHTVASKDAAAGLESAPLAVTKGKPPAIPSPRAVKGGGKGGKAGVADPFKL